MIDPNNKFINTTIIFLFFLVMINCSPQKKEINLGEFNPEMTTKLDLSETNSVILEKYCSNKMVSAEWIKFQYKSKVDTTFSEFKLAKYTFKLKTNLDLGCDYKLIFNIKNKKHLYFFQNFEYDTLVASNGVSYGN